MKWIKASERLPSKSGTYFIIDNGRYRINKKVSRYHCRDHSTNSLFNSRRGDILWLDEQEPEQTSGNRTMECFKYPVSLIRPERSDVSQI